MASSCNPHHFLSQRFSQLLALVLTMTWIFTANGSVEHIEVRGEVGGNVTIHCPSTKHKTIYLFYFQRGDTFINGYFAKKTIPDDMKWENTRVDNGSTTLHMYNLNISHIGTYKCIIRYMDGTENFDNVHLSVTATYSKPEVKVVCSDDSPTCLATCTSHGGYPSSTMDWRVSRSQMWRRVNKSEMEDRNTLMFNSSSTASFNCSEGELMFNCTVGNVTTEMYSICKGPPPPVKNAEILAAIIIIGVVVVAIIVTSVLYWKHKRRQRGVAAADVRQEWRVNGQEEEAVKLKENGGGNEQP
ncbi:putative selection and upkeep of intraepithelial T-cells protein 1 homolog [Acanthopagrus latus]|uniref:putative selection and upkeep of intraepithelial T-cells protein 1 homolog n=1 Tax=Acanthopagrus latus TaxID=8177 RepID=UPI00187D06EC|nr:putative selection and upkeep of intraepithelial T-cells protein 1 homolog [Acanthopagrus latus]